MQKWEYLKTNSTLKPNILQVTFLDNRHGYIYFDFLFNESADWQFLLSSSFVYLRQYGVDGLLWETSIITSRDSPFKNLNISVWINFGYFYEGYWNNHLFQKARQA